MCVCLLKFCIGFGLVLLLALYLGLFPGPMPSVLLKDCSRCCSASFIGSQTKEFQNKTQKVSWTVVLVFERKTVDWASWGSREAARKREPD